MFCVKNRINTFNVITTKITKIKNMIRQLIPKKVNLLRSITVYGFGIWLAEYFSCQRSIIYTMFSMW